MLRRVEPLRAVREFGRILHGAMQQVLKNHVSPVRSWASAQATFPSKSENHDAPVLAPGEVKPLRIAPSVLADFLDLDAPSSPRTPLRDVAKIHARRLYRQAEFHEGLQHALLSCPLSRRARLRAFRLDSWASGR